MAIQDLSTRMDPSAGGGGSGWEQQNRSAGPSLQFDARLGQLVLGWLNEDGSVTPATGTSQAGPYASGYQYADQQVPQSLSTGFDPGIDYSPGASVSPGGGGPGGAGVPFWQRALAPALANGVQGYLNQRNANAQREQQQRESNQRTAVQESQLDPFRGVMYQTRDIGEMERRLQGPRSYRPTFGGGSRLRPTQQPGLSDTYLNSMANTQQLIARGEGTVPTMLNEANWGQTGTQNLTTPQPGATPYRRRLTQPW